MPNNKKYTHLYIPIEIKVREFDAKLMFSLVAAENGFRVVLGGQKDLRKRVAWWPEGIYLDKSVAETKVKWFRYFRKFGHKIVAWDEEGLIIHPETYLDRRFSGSSFNLLDMFFTWGNFQSKVIIDKYREGQEKILVVGNPRMDMLRPELRSYHKPESGKITSKYGKIILINTSFNFYNHLLNREEGKRRFLRNHPEMTEKFIDNWISYQGSIFKAFVDLLPSLRSAFPEHSIIVRPHPAENQATWKKAASSIDNVHVVHENNVTEWIQAADVMVHSNCTTGVESFLLDVPCIAYQPVSSSHYDTYLPNALSWCATTGEEVVDLVKQCIENDNLLVQTEERMKEARDYVTAIQGPLSCEKIIEHLNRLDVKKTASSLSVMEKIKRLDKEMVPMIKRLLNKLKDEQFSSLKAGLAGKKNSTAEFQQKIHAQTIPDILLEEVEHAIEKFRTCTGRFKSVSVRDMGENCFEITSDG